MSPEELLASTEASPDQFDFWCGTWRVETVTGGSEPSGVGRNEVIWLWDRKALFEDFSMPTVEGAFHGRSVSVPVSGRGWCQTWVDSDGQYLSFVGGLVGEEMLLDRVTPATDGHMIRQRMRWWDVAPDGFSWDWLGAESGSAEWTLRWRLRYTRLAVATAAY